MFLADTKVSVFKGDSSVTADGKIRMPPELGVLKIHILTPYICVAFAGDVLLCAQIIQSFIVEKPQTALGILEHFSNGLAKDNDNSMNLQ